MKQLSHWQQPENTRYVWDREYHENARYEAGRKEFEQQKNAMQNETRDALKGLGEVVSVDKVMQEFESSKAKEGFRNAAGQKIKITNNRKRVLETGDGRERIVLKERRNGKNVLKIKESWLKSPKLKLVDHNGNGVIDSDELEQGKVAEEYRVTSETKETRENISHYLSEVDKNVTDLKTKDISKMDVTALSAFRADVVGQENELLKKWTDENWDEHATSAQKEQKNDLMRALESLKDQIPVRENEIAVVEQKDKFEELRKKIDELGNPDNMDAAQLAHLKKQVNDVYEAIKNGPLTEEQANTLRARLDAILQKIEARETAIENEKNGRENLLKGAEQAVGTLPNQAEIIKQLEAGTLNITTLKSNFEKVKSQLDGLETNYEGWTPEQTDRLTQAKESYDKKNETFQQLAPVQEIVKNAEGKAVEQKKNIEKRKQALEKKYDDLEKKMGKTPETLTVRDAEFDPQNLETVQGLAEEIQKHARESQILREEMQVMGDGTKSFNLELVKYEAEKKSFHPGAAVLVGVGAAVGAVGGPWGAALGAFCANKIGQWFDYGEGEGTECDATRKKQDSLRKIFAQKAPKIASKQAQIEQYGEKIQSALTDSNSKVNKEKETALKNMSAFDGIDMTKIEALGLTDAITSAKEKVKKSVEAQYSQPLEEMGTLVTDPETGVEAASAVNAAGLLQMNQGYEYVTNYEITPPSPMDQSVGAVGGALVDAGRWIAEKTDGTFVGPIVGGGVEEVGEVVMGIGGLVENPLLIAKGLPMLVSYNAESGEWGDWSAWRAMGAVDEFQRGEIGRGIGKVAVNLLSLVYGGPKRGFTNAARKMGGKSAIEAVGETGSKFGRKLKRFVPKRGGGLEKSTGFFSKKFTKMEGWTPTGGFGKTFKYGTLGTGPLAVRLLGKMGNEVGKLLNKLFEGESVPKMSTGMSNAAKNALREDVRVAGGPAKFVEKLKGEMRTLAPKAKTADEIARQAEILKEMAQMKEWNKALLARGPYNTAAVDNLITKLPKGQTAVRLAGDVGLATSLPTIYGVNATEQTKRDRFEKTAAALTSTVQFSTDPEVLRKQAALTRLQIRKVQLEELQREKIEAKKAAKMKQDQVDQVAEISGIKMNDQEIQEATKQLTQDIKKLEAELK